MTRPALPAGFHVELDPSTRSSPDGDVVWGGTPWRLLRLTATGSQRLAWLRSGAVVDDIRGGVLARRLVDAGLAHPRPPAALSPNDVDVVVPVRDRVPALNACLAALHGLSVTVVDDRSTDGLAVAAAAAAHGARVVRRDRCGGPAAARNTGLAATRRPHVAFVDSDCVVDAKELLGVAGHLADPCLAAVAPRVSEGDDSSPLDLGPREALVGPGSRVSYVPTTALVVRRRALDEIGAFDESLRYGEDVDLVWRLVAGGWSVRYDPSVVVGHVAPRSQAARLARRYRYGTSAGPLARRHGAAISGPALSGLVAPLRLGLLRDAGMPTTDAVRVAAMAPLRTTAALLRWSTPAGPDDLAYAVGVWRGCMRARTIRPLLPKVRSGRALGHDEATRNSGGKLMDPEVDG
ncbi:MAG TPA: glycosyltransferase [Mycobacteriales bacterium]|nr:glycosyltransferase [Mycobacteriales bacterium]